MRMWPSGYGEGLKNLCFLHFDERSFNESCKGSNPFVRNIFRDDHASSCFELSFCVSSTAAEFPPVCAVQSCGGFGFVSLLEKSIYSVLYTGSGLRAHDSPMANIQITCLDYSRVYRVIVKNVIVNNFAKVIRLLSMEACRSLFEFA